MKFAYIFTLIFLFFFQIQSMDLELTKIIQDDDVQALATHLNNGLDPNQRIILNSTPLLIFALNYGSEKVATYLIENGANVNIFKENQQADIKWTSLWRAFQNYNSSLEMCKLLINKGADIFCLYIARKPLFRDRKIFTIFDLLNMKKVSFEKKQFIAQHIIKLYGKNALEIALSKNCPFKGFVWLIENGAHITLEIVEIAKKFKAKKKIINFLKYQLEMKDQLLKSDAFKTLPITISDLIHEYSHGIKDGEKLDSKIEIISQLHGSIQSNDFLFIEYYLKNKGNPNLEIGYRDQEGNQEGSLLCWSIGYEKEDIARLLLTYGANVNLKAKDRKGCKLSPLWLAFKHDNISLELVKELLNRGADINSIVLNDILHNLTIVLRDKWNVVNNNDKIKFIIDHLLRIYGNKVLNYIVADRKASIEIIKHFIKLGAKVYPETLVIAMKTKTSKKVIKYLQSLLRINKALLESNVEMPHSVIDLINDFDNFDSKKVAESKKCIVS